MGLLTWLEETGLAQFILVDPYAYPVLLALHSVGMAAVVGLVWMMSARVLGYPPGLSVATFRKISHIALWGFLLNATSGLLIFMTEATRVVVNPEFQIKMVSILIGGAATWYIARSANASDGADEFRFPLTTKIVAVAASLAWAATIFFGRQIAYTIKPPF